MAGLGFKSFSAGEVLTAANVQGYLQDQVVMVFNSSAARGSALGTAVSEGMIAYLKDTDAIETYNGTSWVAVGVPTLTASRAVATNGSGALTASTVTATELSYLSGVTSNVQTQLSTAGGLVLVSSQSFSSSTSVVVNNVFTSTYDNYKVVISLSASTAMNLLMRMRAGGTDLSSGNKYFSAAYNSLWGNFNSSDANEWQVGYADLASGVGLSMEFYRPQVSSVDTAITFAQTGGRSGSYVYAPFTGAAGIRINGSYDGFNFYPSTGNITGNVRIYGWKN
jgi:hypothetical protein